MAVLKPLSSDSFSRDKVSIHDDKTGMAVMMNKSLCPRTRTRQPGISLACCFLSPSAKRIAKKRSQG
jgi:hypothetical protein